MSKVITRELDMSELEKLREENRVLRGNVVAAVKRVEELELQLLRNM